MSQLVINDLNFCQSDLSELEEIRGRGWLSISVDVASLVVTDLPNGAGAGFGAAVALALGDGATTFAWGGVGTGT
jgi:hypothetical protein